MQIPLSTKVSLETYQRLEDYREATKIPKSQIVEVALKEYLDKVEKAGN